jgi:uncharacterized protein with PIN domain
MNKCLNCGEKTYNPKFCSRSCGAKYNNHGKRRGTIVENLGKEHLENIISSSTSVSEILRAYNLAISGSNFKILKGTIEKWNISLNILKLNELKHKKENSSKSLDEIFCVNSKTDRVVIKRIIIKNNLLDNTTCSICRNKNIWNGKLIIFILDHINGIRNDNRIENLRYVCPNCNSQLDTFGSKNPYFPNKHKILYCIDCGEIISKGALRCIKCSHLQSRIIKERPSIEELSEDIKILGHVGTGKKYGVSDNTIRKWFKKY